MAEAQTVSTESPLQTSILPPPIGGLNKRDPLHAMASTDAITLDNWVPENSYVRERYGSSVFASIGSGTHVTMLHSVYISASDVDFLIASEANSNDVYEIDSAGTITNVDSASWATEGSYAFNFNQDLYVRSRSVSDAWLIYDSTAQTVASASFTDGGKYFGGGIYKGAIYMCGYSGVAHPSFGYFNVGVVSTATIANWDLSQVAREGGLCLFVGSTTRAKAYAEDNLFVAITNRGEVLAYQGTHPSSGTWSLVGIYKIPRPFGYKSFFYLGGHLYVWTVGGVISMADILSDVQSQGRYNTLSNKIDPLWADLATSTNLSLTNYSTVNNRFACAVNQKENLLYMIAPDNYCYCKNLLIDDGGWFRVSGWPAYSIAVANDKTYIGSTDGRIIRVNDSAATGDYNPATAATDNIATEMQLAYNYLDKPTKRKNITGVKVLSKYTDGLSITIDADIDYATATPTSVTAESVGSGEQTYKTYCGLNGVGEAVSLHQKDSYTATKAAKINAFQIYYKEGDITP